MINLNLQGAVMSGATLSDVESAVRSLDGAALTLLTIEAPSGRRLTVGGGPDVFVAEVAEDDFHRWALIDSSAGEHSVDLVVGGQRVDYPARVCVDLGPVLAAVRTFVAGDGARSAALTWSVET